MDHRKFVSSLVEKYNSKSVAEIGVWRGWLSDHLFRLDLDSLILVDPLMSEFPHCSRRQHSQKELDKTYKDIVGRMPDFALFLRMTSVEAASITENESLDFVFIDADHNRIAEDIDAWLPKIRKGGVISGDDFSTPFPKIRKVVAERFPKFSHVERVWYQQID
jgi:hypothetical protein